MAAFQILLRNYLDNKLNDATNALVSAGSSFKLYNRYAIEDQDFYDVVLDSINWEDEDPAPYQEFTLNTEYDTLAQLNAAGASAQVSGIVYFLKFGSPFKYLTYNSETTNYDGVDEDDLFNPKAAPKNNVVVEYNDVEYNTYLGQYTLNKIKYVPCIIEDFIAEFEPLAFVENVNYTIPITFYINETFDRQINNAIVLGAQQFGNSVRGQTGTLFDPESGKTYKLLSNHTALTPLSGIIDFNGTVFREYQMVIHLELISDGFFGNQIQYLVSTPEISNGTTFQVFPVSAISTRASELHGFQVFGDTDFESKSIPNEVGFMMELSFLYTGDVFTSWLFKQKFTPTPPKKISLLVTYPSVNATYAINEATDYVIESIGGVEQVGEKIILSLVLKPVSEVY